MTRYWEYIKRLFSSPNPATYVNDLPDDDEARTLAIATDAWQRVLRDPTIRGVITTVNDDGTTTVKEMRS